MTAIFRAVRLMLPEEVRPPDVEDLTRDWLNEINAVRLLENEEAEGRANG